MYCKSLYHWMNEQPVSLEMIYNKLPKYAKAIEGEIKMIDQYNVEETRDDILARKHYRRAIGYYKKAQELLQGGI